MPARPATTIESFSPTRELIRPDYLGLFRRVAESRKTPLGRYGSIARQKSLQPLETRLAFARRERRAMRRPRVVPPTGDRLGVRGNVIGGEQRESGGGDQSLILSRRHEDVEADRAAR